MRIDRWKSCQHNIRRISFLRLHTKEAANEYIVEGHSSKRAVSSQTRAPGILVSGRNSFSFLSLFFWKKFICSRHWFSRLTRHRQVQLWSTMEKRWTLTTPFLLSCQERLDGVGKLRTANTLASRKVHSLPSKRLSRKLAVRLVVGYRSRSTPCLVVLLTGTRSALSMDTQTLQSSVGGCLCSNSYSTLLVGS